MLLYLIRLNFKLFDEGFCPYTSSKNSSIAPLCSGFLNRLSTKLSGKKNSKFNLIKYKTWRSWKPSPDSSGYAARSVCTCRIAAAFERIAGSPFLNAYAVSLLKNTITLTDRLLLITSSLQKQ